MDIQFPDTTHTRMTPAEAGMSCERLERAERWLTENRPDSGYRVLVSRYGRLVCEWIDGIPTNDHLMIYSAGKSVYGNILGIAIFEGAIGSADDRVADYYPAMLDVPEEAGPKPGRYSLPKDRDITFRQLISNTSGYLKPDEKPGEHFHYQTFGMNILSHAIASAYGYYDPAQGEASPGIARLIKEKIAEPIGASWSYSYRNFDHHPDARVGIFGNYTEIQTDPYDAVRLGILWLAAGRWGSKQIIPEPWLAESIRANPDVTRICHEDLWRYGYGIWTNEHGKLFDGWDTIPHAAFSACGAHGHFITVFPDESLVVVQNPGPYRLAGRANPELLRLIHDSVIE